MTKKQKFKVGDLVEITGSEDYYFHKGDRAVLLKQASAGDWYADFNNQGNPTITQEGQWWIGDGKVPKEYTFRLVGGDK